MKVNDSPVCQVGTKVQYHHTALLPRRRAAASCAGVPPSADPGPGDAISAFDPERKFENVGKQTEELNEADVQRSG
jgi:hypothetical protein